MCVERLVCYQRYVCCVEYLRTTSSQSPPTAEGISGARRRSQGSVGVVIGHHLVRWNRGVTSIGIESDGIAQGRPLRIKRYVRCPHGVRRAVGIRHAQSARQGVPAVEGITGTGKTIGHDSFGRSIGDGLTRHRTRGKGRVFIECDGEGWNVPLGVQVQVACSPRRYRGYRYRQGRIGEPPQERITAPGRIYQGYQTGHNRIRRRVAGIVYAAVQVICQGIRRKQPFGI